MSKVLNRDTRLEINIDNIKYNTKLIKDQIKNAKFISVVKGDFYGAGTRGLYKIMEELGADMFAVACISEALELRNLGTELDILLLGYTPRHQYDIAIKNNLTVTIFELEDGIELNQSAKKLDKKVKVHLSVDTGMARLGFVDDENLLDSIKEICSLEYIEIEGIFSHLTESEVIGSKITQEQLDKFLDICERVDQVVNIPIKHIANSAAVFVREDTIMDAVRNGANPLGMYLGVKGVNLKPTMELKTIITRIKPAPQGTRVSYNSTYVTPNEQILATLPIGYADGLPRQLSNKGHVVINGQKAPIRGTICMDQMMVDVTDINCQIGDDVTIFGYTDGAITLRDQAAVAGTIDTELSAGITKRVPRVYLENNQVVDIVDYLLD